MSCFLLVFFAATRAGVLRQEAYVTPAQVAAKEASLFSW